MGDRRQAIVKQGTEKVYLYTHWAGSELPEIVKAAMQRGKGRWRDAPYLTRIIFSEMVKGDILGETGAGIWSSNMDSEHPDILIDIDTQTVSIGEEKRTFVQFAA